MVDGRYIIAVPSEDAALNAVLGDLRAIKAQGADVVVFRTRSRESSLVIDEMLAMGTELPPLCLPTTAARPGSPSTAQLITS